MSTLSQEIIDFKKKVYQCMVQMNEVHKMSRDLVVHLLTYQPEGEIENQHHQNWIHDALRVQRALDTCGINHRYVETHQEL